MSPPLRAGLGWSNASWHIWQGETAPAIALRRNNPRGFAADVAYDLVRSTSNRNRALRPQGLNDDEAANVLYFGHVIESVMTESNIRWSDEIWTDFYEAMGALARTQDRPFSPGQLVAFAQSSFYQDVVSHIDDTKPDTLPSIPDGFEIPESVDAALCHLTSIYSGDARKIGKGWFGFSYQTALRRSRKVPNFRLEEIRRQFAKLAIIWGVWEGAAHPAVYYVPFSRSMAIFLLERGWLQTDGERFSTDDPRFIRAFERAEEKLIALAADVLDNANDQLTREWRSREVTVAHSLGLDWSWYAQYRVDQHIYHMARNFSAEKWRVGDRCIEKVVPTSVSDG